MKEWILISKKLAFHRQLSISYYWIVLRVSANCQIFEREIVISCQNWFCWHPLSLQTRGMSGVSPLMLLQWNILICTFKFEIFWRLFENCSSKRLPLVVLSFSAHSKSQNMEKLQNTWNARSWSFLVNHRDLYTEIRKISSWVFLIYSRRLLVGLRSPSAQSKPRSMKNPRTNQDVLFQTYRAKCDLLIEFRMCFTSVFSKWFSSQSVCWISSIQCSFERL